MAGRQMVFMKRGDAATPPKGAPDTGSDNNEPPKAEDESAEMVTCPECGCQFDPDQTQDDQEAKDGKPDSDGMKGGADLQIPAPTGDAQAPVGEDAITRAIAAVLSGGH